MAMPMAKWKMTWGLVAVIFALAARTSGAQTLDGVAIDGDAELVVAVPDDTTNMDPRLGMGSTRSNYIRQVYESLVDVDAQGKPVPGLALSWKPVSDLAWEFTLHRGVTFHNGEAFNADTVLFHSSEPLPNLWDVIGREPLVPREYAIKNGVEALNERPVGTGPWKMTGWKRNDAMRFERYESYWGPPPLFKRLRFQVIPEAGGRLAALRAGQVGLVDAVPPLDAGVLGREPGIKVTSSAQKLYCRIYLNARPRDKFDSGGKDGLFVDPRVRLE